MEFGERLVALRKERGATREEFAAYLGISKYTLRNYELGKTEPSHVFLKYLADVFKVSVDYLLCLTDNRTAPSKSAEYSQPEKNMVKKYRDLDPHGKEVVDCVMDIETARMQKERQTNVTTPADKVDTTNIVYFEEKVSAGRGWEFMDGGQRMLSVHENDLTRKADYAVSVKGDSMLPMYADGDILLVREQPDVNIGEVGIFIAAGKAYVKKRGTHSLISINEGYPDISIPEGETAVCQGKVLGVLRPEWIAEMDME